MNKIWDRVDFGTERTRVDAQHLQWKITVLISLASIRKKKSLKS